MEIKVEQPTRQFLEDRKVGSWGIWEKEVSRFDWYYDATEECYILEGEVVVETKDGAGFNSGKGTLLPCPKGFLCVGY